MPGQQRQRRGPADAIVCPDIGERYVGRHVADEDERDPGFCCCGLGMDAWVHTDNTHYTETPLAQAWPDLRRAT